MDNIPCSYSDDVPHDDLSRSNRFNFNLGDDIYDENYDTYLEITDEILDGIFAAEECGEVTTTDEEEDKDDNTSDCDCDWKISTHEESDYKTYFQDDSLSQVLKQATLPEDKEHHSIIHHLVQYFLPFATPAHSALFIIILSIINISYSIWEGEF